MQNKCATAQMLVKSILLLLQTITTFHLFYLQVTFANVIGVLKGERFGQESDRILGVAAHYDTVPNSPGAYSNAKLNI